MHTIAFIGSGPMATYGLKHLLDAQRPLAISLFEASPVAGVGMPYRSGMNADCMLCNAFSREIPPATRSLLDWLKDQPARELSEWELSRHDLTARAFYPRVLIGEYLQSEFEALCARAAADGHEITVHTDSRVTDIRMDTGRPTVAYRTPDGPQTAAFDDVIIATGHAWPARPSIDGVDLVSPWPYTRITNLQADDIGVLGSSLSAIDCVIALGHAHGRFDETEDRVAWLPHHGSEALSITMVSHQGIMPEGDFYYPYPYEPLTRLTEAAVAAEVARGPEGLLDRVFDLLCAELDAADPDYLAGLPASAQTVEGFGPAYFAQRRALGGLKAVKRDLAKARDTLRRKQTVPHRYALLRGHGVFDHALRHLSDDDYTRFQAHLMPVFGDCYAAVPHLSLARVLALYDAGVLDLVATGADSRFSQTDDGRIEVSTEEGPPLHVAAMIDARGQPPAALSDLPFPSLVDALRDDAPLEAPFQLDLDGLRTGRVFCLALPQLLQRHPFAQGLVECDELARVVAERIVAS